MEFWQKVCEEEGYLIFWLCWLGWLGWLGVFGVRRGRDFGREGEGMCSWKGRSE